MTLLDLLSTTIVENTLGGLLIASFLGIVYIFVKQTVTNYGNIRVAKINSNVSLNEQALQVMTAAIETLKDENQNLKNSLTQMESHMDQIIDFILQMMKAQNQEEADRVVKRLEQFLKSIGRWQY